MGKKGYLSILMGLLLIAAALSICVYNFWSDTRAGRLAEQAAEELATEIFSSIAVEESDALVLQRDADAEMPTQLLNGLEYIGILEIPALELSLPIIRSWSYPNLQISPCRFSGSVYRDDMILAAHNYSSHFGKIKNLSSGDYVYFTDVDGNVFAYQVVEQETIQPNDLEGMTAGDWDLTLFTCTVGGQTRVTVRCDRV